MKESDIKRHIIQWLKYQRCFCWVNTSVGIWDPTKNRFRKLNGYGQIRGVSDVLGIWQGKPLAIEVKRPGQLRTVSFEQSTFLRNFREAGGIGFVATSVEDVERELSGRS